MLVDPWICGLAGAAAGFLGLMAYLSALETAVLSARRSRLAQAGPEKRAAAADAFLNSPEGFQGSSLLAKSLCEAGAYGAALLLGLGLPGNPAEAVRPSEWVARNWGGGVAGLAVSYFVVVLVGQTLPKSMATRNPERILLGSLAFLQVFTLLWKPLLWVTRSLGRTLAQSTGTEPALTARAAHSEEEIKLLVEGSAEEGVLEEEEKEMIHSVIEFTDTVARQVMVPRTDVDCIRADATVDEAVRLVLDTGHSRIPVYEGTLDHVVGVLHVKDALPLLITGDHNGSIQGVMRPPFFVPESKKLDDLLREFRAARSQLAIVVDEFGGTSGLVTMEDVVEEIVGEIEDEYDPEETVEAEGSAAEGMVVDARTPIDDLNEELGLGIPHGTYDTVGGFVFSLLGRPPRAGETAEHEGIRYVVLTTEGLRIRRIRIVRPVPGVAADES